MREAGVEQRRLRAAPTERRIRARTGEERDPIVDRTGGGGDRLTCPLGDKTHRPFGPRAHVAELADERRSLRRLAPPARGRLRPQRFLPRLDAADPELRSGFTPGGGAGGR